MLPLGLNPAEAFLFLKKYYMGFWDFWNKDKKKDLDQGLEKTKSSFFGKLKSALLGKSKIDDDTLDEIEHALISADVGVDTTIKIINRLEEKAKEKKFTSLDELNQLLKETIQELIFSKPSEDFTPFEIPSNINKPYVILVVGVNGVGKTTTIGKLAYQFKQRNYNVILGAADTFRAAAIEQLKLWGERTNTPVIAQKMGSDPAAVAYDTVQSAKAKNADIAIIDTAGRLHNKTHLMNELTKIKKSIQKIIPDAPHEILLVLDATTGQNAFEQAKQFTSATQVNAIALTKLDGTAKGGVVIGISDQYKIPVKYIGVGEKPDQLQPFHPESFLNSFFDIHV